MHSLIFLGLALVNNIGNLLFKIKIKHKTLTALYLFKRNENIN